MDERESFEAIGGMMLSNSSRGVFVLFALLLAAGCSWVDSGHNGRADNDMPRAGESAIKIDSEPSGADVFAMGEKIGTTPLITDTKKFFPSTYPTEKESLYGKVTFKKEGCSELTRTVSAKLIVLRGELECSGPKPAAQEASRGTSAASATAEQRLTKIKELLDKGLITEEEAKKARERVLNDL